jgi:hypothetical protein
MAKYHERNNISENNGISEIIRKIRYRKIGEKKKNISKGESKPSAASNWRVARKRRDIAVARSRRRRAGAPHHHRERWHGVGELAYRRFRARHISGALRARVCARVARGDRTAWRR